MLIKGRNEDELLFKIHNAFNRIDAFDANGNSMLRKDLYLKNLS